MRWAGLAVAAAATGWMLTAVAPVAAQASAPATSPSAVAAPVAETSRVPPTAPATAPATAPVDSSTPKGALKMLTEALEAGDRAALLDLLSADSPAEQRIAEATAGLAEATAELRRASIKAFGPQASQPLGVNESAVPEAMARIDSSTVAIDGDKATLTSPQDQGESLSLVQRGGKWRVPMSQIAGPADGADLDKNLRDSAEQAKVLKALAAEVSEGKFKSAMEARQELNKRIMQLAMPGVQGATTRATTAPVKR